jgi:hypothetical protein
MYASTLKTSPFAGEREFAAGELARIRWLQQGTAYRALRYTPWLTPVTVGVDYALGRGSGEAPAVAAGGALWGWAGGTAATGLVVEGCAALGVATLGAGALACLGVAGVASYFAAKCGKSLGEFIGGALSDPR